MPQPAGNMSLLVIKALIIFQPMHTVLSQNPGVA